MVHLAGCGSGNDYQVETQTTETTVEQTTDLTIPKDYVMVTESYDVTNNEDGSVTYHLTLSEYDDLLAYIREDTELALQGLVKDIESFTVIEHDENFQNFTVETSNTELSFREATSMITLFSYGKMYNAYFGNLDAIISITYIHAGTEIYSCDSGQSK